MPNITRILVPIDLSDHSREALDYAVFVAGRFSAPIEVLHVWEAATYIHPQAELVGAEGGPLSHTAAERARVALDAFLRPWVEAGANFARVRLEHGEPAKVIVAVAAEEHSNLIIMGSQGRGAIERWFVGSVAEKVQRHAPCPVLTVRAGTSGGGEKHGA